MEAIASRTKKSTRIKLYKSVKYFDDPGGIIYEEPIKNEAGDCRETEECILDVTA